VRSTAYVADSEFGLQVIDIMSPESPRIVGSVDTPGSAYGVAVSGKYAYVTDGSGGLQAIDIANPESPRIVGSVDTPGFAYDVAVLGGTAYVADGSGGLHVIDIANPSSPGIVGSVHTPGVAYGVAVLGNYAYVAAFTSRIVGSVDTPGFAYDVAVVGSTAYVADGSGGLEVIDIANPESPGVLGGIDTPGVAYRVAVVGSYAYVADFTAGLQIMPVQCTVAPVLELSLGVLQNPHLTQFTEILLTASEILDPASVSLTVGGRAVGMDFVDATENVWKADYELTDETTVQIDVRATSTLGASDYASTSFGAFAVMTGEPATVNSPDQTFHARIEGRGLKTNGYLLVIPSAAAENDAGATTELGQEGLLSFVVSPPSLFSSGLVNVEFHYADTTLPAGTDESQLFIDHVGVGRLASVIDPERCCVHAIAGALGKYHLTTGPPGSSKIADPRVLWLDPNYPNPFNPTTTIRFEIETGQHVRLDVYDVSGRFVRTLVDEVVPPGVNLVRWDGKSQQDDVSSGVYFARIRTSSRTATRKMVLIR
jgi:hypothetical protein